MAWRLSGRRMISTSAGWVFLPALGSPLAHAPVLRWDLMPALNRPISKRLFGANKTWRGVLMMNAGTVAGAETLYRIPAYRQRLPRAVAGCHGRVGMILGVAIWAGELPNSFVKRRLGIPPGQQKRSPLGAVISLFDQADWVPVASVLLRPVWRMSRRDVVEVAALVTVIHIPINVIGYLIGARTAPM